MFHLKGQDEDDGILRVVTDVCYDTNN